MTNEEQPERPGDRTCGGAAGRVEIGRAVVDIRFEVGSFAPFVPGIDANERLAEERIASPPIDKFRQPSLVLAGRRAVQVRPVALPPRVVVPVRNARS